MTNDLKGSLAWSVGIVAIALVATLARQLNFIDGDTVTRIVLGVTGLMVAWYGNRMPKAFVTNTEARKVTRVGGWSMALSGLVYAGLWAFAPMSVALLIGCGAVLAGIVLTIGYCVSLRAKARAS
jgi:hypothetical protein